MLIDFHLYVCISTHLNVHININLCGYENVYTISYKIFQIIFLIPIHFFSRHPPLSSFNHLMKFRVGSHKLWLPTENVITEPQYVAPY